jgi:hypothetical protein
MVVETGEIIENADSYVDIDFADNYFSSRGESSWTGLSTENKEYALIKGTDFVDSSFDWYGKKSTSEQCLNFPRLNLFDKDGYEINGIPSRLKKAVCIAALMISQGTDLFQVHESNGVLASESIGSVSFSYNNSLRETDKTLYDSINLLLRGLYVDYSKSQLHTLRIRRVL